MRKRLHTSDTHQIHCKITEIDPYFTEVSSLIPSYLFGKIFLLQTVFAIEILTKFCFEMSLAEKKCIYHFVCGWGFMLLLHPVYPSIPIIKRGALFTPYLF